jgi:hypothetical protein
MGRHSSQIPQQLLEIVTTLAYHAGTDYATLARGECAMRVVEFDSVLTSECVLVVPPAVAAQVPLHRPVRVLVLIAEDAPVQQDWKDQTEQLLPEDHTSDTLYDQPSRE